MLKFKTTKPVQTNLHDDTTHLVEFRFTYTRVPYGMCVKCDAFKIDGDVMSLILGGGSYREIQEDELNVLMQGAMAITPDNDNPLEYMDSLVIAGIKLAITTEGLWRNQLTMDDFE